MLHSFDKENWSFVIIYYFQTNPSWQSFYRVQLVRFPNHNLMHFILQLLRVRQFYLKPEITNSLLDFS